MPTNHHHDERPSDLKGILTHINMVLFGAGEFVDGTDSHSQIRNLYHTFATGHLISTMFLLDRDGGLVGRLLDRHGLAFLLAPVSQVLQTSLGRTTVGDFIRVTRNRLMTHRWFSEDELPSEIREVRNSPQLLAEFEAQLSALRSAILAFGGEIEARLRNGDT